MMNETSKGRRLAGRLGILAVAAVTLPLTATIVPAVVAQESETDEAAEPAVVRKQVKIIRIKHKDGENVDVISHDGDGKEVTKVQRDGKTFIFHTDRKLSEEELEKMIAEAEKSRAEAEEKWGEAEAARADAEAARGEADVAAREAEKHRGEADIARGQAEIARSHAEAARRQSEVMRVQAHKMALAYIPEIDIREITRNCSEGQPVSTVFNGFDGQNKSRVRLVMCGKGQVKLARVEAIKGLREARSNIRSDKDIPDSVRKDIVEKLEQQIRSLEAQAD